MDMKQVMVENPILAIMRNVPTEKVLDYVGAAIDGGVKFFEVALNSKDAYAQIKLFPAGDMPKGYVKSLKGPFDETEYVAIGGVNKENMAQFFQQGYLGVGIGRNMIPKELVQNNHWAEASAYVADLMDCAKHCKENSQNESMVL